MLLVAARADFLGRSVALPPGVTVARRAMVARRIHIVGGDGARWPLSSSTDPTPCGRSVSQMARVGGSRRGFVDGGGRPDFWCPTLSALSLTAHPYRGLPVMGGGSGGLVSGTVARWPSSAGGRRLGQSDVQGTGWSLRVALVKTQGLSLLPEPVMVTSHTF
jgi:hypothetical protein